MKAIKKIISVLLVSAILLCGSLVGAVAAPAPEEGGAMKLDCRSAILMEASTGEVLYEMNADEALPPASAPWRRSRVLWPSTSAKLC